MSLLKHLFLAIMALLLSANLPAQTLTGSGGCNSTLTVTNLSNSPINLYRFDQVIGNGCIRTATDPTLNLRRVIVLQKKNSSGNFVFNASSSSGTFSNLSHGTYRAMIRTPRRSLFADCSPSPAGPVQVINFLGSRIGFVGFLPLSGPVTNEVVVGATVATDLVAEILENGSPSTDGNQAVDANVNLSLDVSGSTNYDVFNIRIEEADQYGEKTLRHFTSTWEAEDASNAPLSSTTTIIDLNEYWFDGDFLANHQYNIRFSIAKSGGCASPGGLTSQTFYRWVCPIGQGCKEGLAETPIALSPNPASTSFLLQNFEPYLNDNCQLSIFDLTGKLVKSITVISDRIDISDLDNGMYLVQVTKGEIRLLNTKMVVSK